MRYSNLIGELAKRKVSKEKISECLKIHRNSVTYKLNGGTFSVEEAVQIRDTFFPECSLEYLFATEEQKEQNSRECR